MTDTTAGMRHIRTLVEKLQSSLAESGEPPNLDEFTPQERGQIRRGLPLYDTEQKIGAAVYFMAIAADPKGRRALEWGLACFIGIITVWDGLMVLVRIARWLRSSIAQILIAGGVVAGFTLNREDVEWLAELLKSFWG